MQFNLGLCSRRKNQQQTAETCLATVHGVNGVQKDEEVEGDGNEATRESTRDMVAESAHYPADRRPAGVAVPVLPEDRYGGGRGGGAGEHHAEHLQLRHQPRQKKRMK